MLTGLAQHADKLKFLMRENSPTILTGVGVGGTVITAYLTGRASFKAARIIDQLHETEKASLTYEREEDGEEITYAEVKVDLTRIHKIKAVWKLYIPPVGMGATTIISIIAANKISSKRLAALGVAAGISERALQEYKEKVFEKLGERQNQKIRDEIAQDRVTKNPENSQVVVVGTGKVLCYDMLTGRYFESSVEDIKRAENKVNREFLNHMYASLSEFYDELGLPPTAYTDSVGWNGDEPINVVLSTVMSSDNRPCIAVDFNRPPVLEYARFYS